MYFALFGYLDVHGNREEMMMIRRKRTSKRILLVLLLVVLFCMDFFYDCNYSNATEIIEEVDETSETSLEEQKTEDVNENQQEDIYSTEQSEDEIKKEENAEVLSLEEYSETKSVNSLRGITAETETGSVETENGAYRMFYYIDEDANAVISWGYAMKAGDLLIPQYINGHEVIRIEDEAFRNAIDSYDRGGELKIPSSVKWIGDRAFEGCSRILGKLVIPDGVEHIGEQAFYGCKGITELQLSANLKEIGDMAFCCCSRIGGKIVVPNGVVHIRDSVFAGCEDIVEVELSNKTKDIGAEAFEGCHSLERINIAKTTESIGERAFQDCIRLNQKVTIPSSCKEIGLCAFLRSGIEGVYFEKGVEKIGGAAFAGCVSIEGLVVIPDSVTEIEKDTFLDCVNIQAIRNETDHIIDLPKGTGFSWIVDTNIEPITEIGRETAYRSDNDKFGYVSYENKWEYYKFTYSDFRQFWYYAFRDRNSIPYNEMVAKESIRIAMSAFGNGIVRDINIHDTMTKMGFKNIKTDYPIPTSETIGSAIGHYELDDSTSVILVAIRGGGYEAEWSDNFLVKSKDEYEPDHAGFSNAANKVVERLNSYITNNEDTLNDNIILWFTGYSRGGAVANIAAARALDGKVVRKGKAVTTYLKDNVYAYCFECPKTTRVAFSVACQSFNYGGIYNIINPVDFVPQLPVGNYEGWDYRRYGTTYVIPSKVSNPSNFEILNESMIRIYKAILDSHIIKPSKSEEIARGLSRFSGVISITGHGYSFENTPQEADIWNFVSVVVGATNSPEEFYGRTVLSNRKLNSLLNKYHINIDVEADFSGQQIAQIAMGAILGKESSIKPSDSDVDQNEGNPVFKAHYPELCLAWMDSISTYELSKRKTFNGIVINCPVDVGVYDETGSLIEQIVDDEPQVIDDSIIAEVDENGQKIVYVPGEGKYSVVLKPTDNGTMTVSTLTIGMAEMSIDQLNVFEDVPIQSGCDYTLTVDNSQSNYSSKYVLKDENNTTVSKRKYFDSSRIKWYTVNVISEGDGETQGGGSFIPGEYAKVIATPKEKGQFEGWYVNGECVSTELEYRFAVKSNVTIKAVFGESKPQIRVELANDESYIYTGKEIRPEVSVYYGDELLHADTDYTVSYINNVHVSDSSDGDHSPKIIVEGKGEYEGTSQLSFTILPCDISGSDFNADDISVKATGDNLAFNPILFWNERILTKGDYTVEYYCADENGHASGDRIENIKDVGDYVLRFTGRGNFTGNKDIRIIVTERLRSLDDVSISEIPDQQYTGFEIAPSINISDGDYTLVLSHDYEISITNNVEVGTAIITVNGIGDYKGQREVSFNIVGRSINSAIVEGIPKCVPYGGPNTTINGIKLYYKQNASRYDLVEGRDYSISYTNNNKIGTATLTINGINGYNGSLKKTFKIVPYCVSGISDNNLSVSLDSDEVEYSKCGAEPIVTVFFNCSDGSKVILKKGIDYVTLCCNNKKVNDRSNPRNVPVLKICFRGNYSGTITRTYSIIPKDISGFRVLAENRIYQNKKNIYKTNIAVIDEHGMILSPYSDYIKDIEYRYKEDTWVISNKKKELRLAESVVRKGDIIPADTVIRVIVKAKVKGNYRGEATGEYKITKNNIILASISITKQTYTGKPITIDEDDIKVKLNGETLIYGVDYEIVENSYKNNTNIGTATFMIMGVDNYFGTKETKCVIKRKHNLGWRW